MESDHKKPIRFNLGDFGDKQSCKISIKSLQW